MTGRQRIFALALTACCTLAARLAAAATNPVQSAQQDAAGVTLNLQTGILRLDVCNDRTLHVVACPTQKLPESKELVVNRTWTPTPFQWNDQGNQLALRTTQGGMNIDRATGVLSFVDAAGRIILREPADGGRVLEAKSAAGQPTLYRATQSFVSPDDEHLYGMAEGQDGTWNWHGMPIELRQLNTQSALPVLISSKGYGLLWDNASLTDFNPVDDEIPLSATQPATTGPQATEQLPGAAAGNGGARGGRGRGATAPRVGSFTTGAAGDYVFFVKNGNRSAEIGIVVNDQTIAHIQNQWVPYTTAGKITLPAHATVPVRVLGGGPNTKLYARPLGNTTTFRAATAEAIDYYLFLGPQFDDIIASYRNATGDAPLWPRWAYGFWQCRERYSSQQQILDTVSEFRRRQIPLDLIVQDWQYWGNHGWGAYEWDSRAYPDPEKMITALHQQNVKFMISCWSNPAVSSKVGKAVKSHGFNLGNTDWIDQFNPAARDLRWNYMNDAFFKLGTDAFWQDATEPGDDGNSMAGKKVYLGSGDLYRNAYPLVANQTVYDGARAADPEKRVVTLTRSAFPGQQRYATAIWSGDINGNWETLRRQIPAGLNVCLTGLPYWTTDCGGFFRPQGQYQSDDFADLLTRWFEFSTFCPVQRMHGYQTETEFWKFPKAADNLIAYDKLRYRLLPYIYSLAWRVTRDRDTMMRALPMDFPADASVYDIADQYMFGPAFLVSPVVQPKAETRNLYLPASTAWVNFWTGEAVAGGKRVDVAAPEAQIPLFVRAGSIIPMGPDLQYADEKAADPIELRIYRGADGSFTLYEDEGNSYRYKKGAYATIPFSWNDGAKTLTIGERAGEFAGMPKQRTFRIAWVRPGKGNGGSPDATADVEVHYEGQAIQVKAP